MTLPKQPVLKARPAVAPSPEKITLETLRQMRSRAEPIAMLTCYDYSLARILSGTGIHILLVGDSAAMTVLGENSTIHATMDFMLTITHAVRLGAPQSFVLADMPFASYATPDAAVANAARLLTHGQADAVKLECDAGHVPIIAAMHAAGIPTCAHLGLLPQRAAQHGGYKAQGRSAADADKIVNDAVTLWRAGADMLLLEAVPDPLSSRVVAATDCPVLGCGAGPSCHGHVVVLHDLLGFTDKPPRFVEKMADVPAVIFQAVERYVNAVKNRQYPLPRHGYTMKEGQ